MTLEELKVIITAETAGLKKEVAGLKGQLGGVSSATQGMASKMNSAFSAIKTSMAVYAIKKVADALLGCINTAGKTETALLGLERILTAQGRSFGQANAFIKQYISDGLVPLQDAIVAYKNLAARGYDNKQIEDIMNRFKDAAAFGRQGHLTMGEAIKTGTEGLKNENSILVDNVGITKNVAKMWEDYADKIGKTRDSLTDAEKRTAEYNGIMKESQFQVGDAIAYTQTYDGQVARLGATFTMIKTNIGEAFMPIATVVLPLLQNLANALAQITAYIASFVKALFGVSGTQKNSASNAQAIANANNNAAGAMDKAGGSAEKAGKKAKKAGKDAQSAIAAFDEVNQLNMSKGGSGDGGGTDGSGATGAGGLSPVKMEDTGLNTIPEEAQKLIDRFKNVFNDLGAWFKNVASLFSPGIETLKNMFKQDFEDIKTFLIPLEGAFEDIGERWIKSVNYRMPILADAFNTIMPIIDGVHREVFGTLVLNSQRFADDVRRIFISTFDFGDAIYEPTTRVFTQISGVVLPIMGDLSSRILQIFFDTFNALSEIFAAALEPLKTIILIFLENLSQWFTDNAQSIRDGFTKAFDDIQIRVTEAIQGIKDEAIRIFTDLNTWFLDNTNVISDTLTNTWDTIRDVLKGTWTIISTVAFAIWDSLKEFFSKHIDEIHKKLMDTWDIIAKGVMDVWNGLLDTAKKIFNQLSDWFKENADSIKNTLTKTWETIWDIIRPIWTVIQDTAKAIFDALAYFFKENSSKIADFIKSAWDLIWSVIKPLWELILSVAKKKFGELEQFWNVWGKGILDFLGGIFRSLSDVFGGVLDTISGLFKIFSGLFSGNWGKMWNGVKQVFKGIWESLGGIVKGVFNVIIGVINAAINAINDAMTINVPDWDILPDSIQGKTFSMAIPKIPYLAKGGITTGPTLAMIGEGAENEVVSPISKLNEIVTKGMFDALSMRDQFQQPQQSQQGGDIILQVDGTTFARIIGPYTNQENQRIGNNLIIQTV